MPESPACVKIRCCLKPPYPAPKTLLRMLKSLRFALACLLAGALPALAQVVPGEPSKTPKAAAATPILRLAPKAIPGGVTLAPVEDSELVRLRAANRANVSRKRLAVGIERRVTASVQGTPVERWSAVAGGLAAQASMTSPDAGAMRIGLDLRNVAPDTEMVFFGSDAPRIFKALVEATCFGAKAIVERFINEGVPIKGLIGLGGVAKKSPYIMQVMSDVIGMPIRIHKSEQTCAIGAAMFAATVAGLYPSVESAMDAMGQGFDKEYHPDASRKAFYEKRYAAYKKLGTFAEQSVAPQPKLSSVTY